MKRAASIRSMPPLFSAPCSSSRFRIAREDAGNGVASAGSVLAVPFRESEQLVRIAQHDTLTATFDQALLLPCAQNAAYGVKRGAGHLGNILPTDRKIDFHTFFDFAAGLLGESQQCV